MISPETSRQHTGRPYVSHVRPEVSRRGWTRRWQTGVRAKGLAMIEIRWRRKDEEPEPELDPGWKLDLRTGAKGAFWALSIIAGLMFVDHLPGACRSKTW